MCRCCSQVINSVIMDDVVVGDHAHIQNTIVCRGSTVHDRCSLRDCQVCTQPSKRHTKPPVTAMSLSYPYPSHPPANPWQSCLRIACKLLQVAGVPLLYNFVAGVMSKQP